MLSRFSTPQRVVLLVGVVLCLAGVGYVLLPFNARGPYAVETDACGSALSAAGRTPPRLSPVTVTTFHATTTTFPTLPGYPPRVTPSQPAAPLPPVDLLDTPQGRALTPGVACADEGKRREQRAGVLVLLTVIGVAAGCWLLREPREAPS